MKIKSKFKYAYFNNSRNLVLNFLIIIQLTIGILGTYYGADLYLNNKNKKEVSEKSLRASKIYQIESAERGFISFGNKNINDKNLEEKSLNALKFFENKKDNFLYQSKAAFVFKYFKGSENLSRENRTFNIENDLYYSPEVLLINSSFIKFYDLKVSKGRPLSKEELEPTFNQSAIVPAMAGKYYEKYLNIGDKITYFYDDQPKREIEIVGFIDNNSYFSNFQSNGESISLDKYIVSGYNMNYTANDTVNQTLLACSYLVYDSNLKNDDINDDIKEDFFDVFGKNIGLRNINSMFIENQNIRSSYFDFIMKSMSIIIAFILATIIISSIYIVSKRNKEFKVYMLCGFSIRDIFQIIFIEIYSLFLISITFSSTIIIRITDYSLIRLISINVLILIISIVVSIIPPLIQFSRINEVLKGDL